ncbi:unnamed protein product [Aureobasidium uvarum]|uniref:Uncharacterized protein n=1 Tax=Aureobasidium uvarum TaxID=2773716 RepID=A0A9N8KKJ8_9PEZI|nr:unnamed protein product [Aureobasidium uvarum]
MSSRMPSIRRPVRTTTKAEDPVDNPGTVNKRSQLPQLTPRSLKISKDVSASSLPMSSPTRPTMAIPTSRKEDKTAMPPPSAPLGRTQSIRTRPIPQPSASTTATSTRSGMVPPHDRYQLEHPPLQQPLLRNRASYRILEQPVPRPSQHRATGDSTMKRSGTITSSSRHVRSQSSTTTGLSSRLATPSAPSTPTSTRSSAEPAKPPIRRLVRPGITSSVPNLEPPTSRPAFNTLQQHYSPAKTTLPKPPVPPSRAAPSAEEKAVQSGAAFETTKLQSELLYLSILHESAGPNFRKYEKSARKALQAEFEATQDEVEQIREQERMFQEQGNLAAIADWLGVQGAHASPEAAEMIQSLSGCFNEVMVLSSPESKYTALVHGFSEWANEATEQDRAHVFSGPLPQDWHHTHASITQRLRLVEREVELLPSAPPRIGEAVDSSLSIMLKCLKDLVSGMKEELEAMVRLEQQVVSTEKQRVSDAVAGLSMDTLLQCSEEWAAAW